MHRRRVVFEFLAALQAYDIAAFGGRTLRRRAGNRSAKVTMTTAEENIKNSSQHVGPSVRFSPASERLN